MSSMAVEVRWHVFLTHLKEDRPVLRATLDHPGPYLMYVHTLKSLQPWCF